MSFKNNITFILFFLSLVSFSQELANSIPLHLKKDQDVFQVVDKVSKQTTLFVSDKNKVKAIQLNEKMQIIDSISVNRPDKSFTDMIGFNGDKSNPRLFWASSDYRVVTSQFYDLKNRKTSSQTYNLQLKDEKIIQKFSENDKFYILTVVKKSSLLKLYVFNSDGTQEEKNIDTKHLHFLTAKKELTDIYGILTQNLLPFEASFPMQKINTKNPTSLTESAKKRKCYSNDNQIIITLDINTDSTQILTIDLKDYSISENFIIKPVINFVPSDEMNTNSFLIDDKLFQMKIYSAKMIFTIKDLQDNLLKKYETVASSTINFKNSEIYQENGDANKQIIEKNSRFLEKVNNSNSGISCYKVGDDYVITLGSISEAQTSNPLIYGGFFGVAGVVIAVAISNPTFESFNSYANRKVVYINCLFDKDGNHLQGEIKPVAFDNIREFLRNKKNITSPTLYKLDSFYYLGFYEKKEELYKIMKFVE